ncbi:MAG TPA: hypothetical protein VLJ59_20960 [Mycobacteriales bacterium]|nr:hypothetical protein [Mycobacteriales bacterium]
MNLRDRVEAALCAWDGYEAGKGAPRVIDYDCRPTRDEVKPANNRLAVYRELHALYHEANSAGETRIACRVAADLAYLGALLGERPDIETFIRLTQGCAARGWPPEYVTARGKLARDTLKALGVTWGPNTTVELDSSEGVADAGEAPDAIRHAADELEPLVRQLTGADPHYDLTIATAHTDQYWSYWLDGAGQQSRLRLNLRRAKFTNVRIRQFALHEVLGHALQSASLAALCARVDVPWVRLLSVHAPHQVLMEGVAQALPLFVTPHDSALIARVRLDHYLQLVRSELHLFVNTGMTVSECVRHARFRVPFWPDEEIADALTDRSTNPQLRSYLWAYPAGLDWFVALADANADAIPEVLHAAYRGPLTPDELMALWPAGPPIGGPEGTVRLRKPSLS